MWNLVAWIKLGPGTRIQGWLREEEVVPGNQRIQVGSNHMMEGIRRIKRIGAGHRGRGVSGKHRGVPNMVLGNGH